ncbi:hypothetical protein AGRA3207_005481 [Actinomadura graeca]|uniref:FtsX-like permease family protein n=1 Tax=Actinomadura graeca TaxID=2750812 RepID=A0ABX8R0Y0_9ACTN|nr:hypothetical protein [Actinomadura graeca]QXJ24206.1 hypothetical protein AGRA3207_005481 [Actinomadura graeca]
MNGPLLNGAWARLAREQRAPLVALAAMTFVTALLAVTVPARVAAGYDRAAGAAVSGQDVRVEARTDAATLGRFLPLADDVTVRSATWYDDLPADLRRVVGAPETSVGTNEMATAGPFLEPRLVTLAWDPGALKRVRFVAGTPPEDPPGDGPADGPGGKRGQEIQVAVSKAYADRFGYRPGTPLDLSGGDAGAPPRQGAEGLRARVAGVYVPRDAADPYWTARADMLWVRTELRGEGVRVHIGTALASGGGYWRLAHGAPGRRLTVSWRFPVDAGAVGRGTASGMAADLEAYRAAVRNRGDLFPCAVVTALDARLRSYAGQLRSGEAVIALTLSGLAAIAAGVLLLGAGMLGRRLGPVLATMRARGASLRQLAAPACGLPALAVLPAAAAGSGAGLLLDTGPPQAASACAVGALVVLVLALPAVTIVRDHGAGERGGGLAAVTGRRGDLVVARPSRRRLVLEALLIVLAAMGVVLLRGRGAGAGADPLIAAVPVLLGAATGVLVLRVYPYLLRALGRTMRRGPGIVAFVGVARASRQGVLGALPLVVLLLAAAVAGFAATVGAALERGQDRAAWAVVGADARVSAELLDRGAVARVRALPGVRDAVPARIVRDLRPASGPVRVTLIAIDLEGYQRVAPGRLPAHPRGALLSPAAAGELGTRPLTLSSPNFPEIRVEPSGRIDDFPGVPHGTPFVVVPFRALTGTGAVPSTVYVRGDPGTAALRGALQASLPPGLLGGDPYREVQVRRDVLDGMRRAPMVGVVQDTFRDAALLGAAYGLLAVLLVLVVEARSRGRGLAHLHVLGLTRRQGRRLAVVEIAPVLLSAAGAGWVLGLLLPGVTGPVVDLRPYTGGHAVSNHAADPAALPALLAVLLLAAATAVAVDRAFDTRHDLAAVLRTGD